MTDFMKIINQQEELPNIGTAEAAVLSCVSMFAHICAKSEPIVQYWLDLYYQVRLAYEVEKTHRRAAESGAWCRQVQAQPVGPTEGEAEKAEEASPAPQDQVQEKAPPVKPTSGPEGFEPVAPNKGGAPRGNTNGADAAQYKREVLARLMKMRGDGITIERIVRESKGNLTDDIVLNILQARKMAVAYYRHLNAALDRIEAEGGITRT